MTGIKNNQIIASGFNQNRQKCDPTLHAEIVALRNACEIKKSTTMKYSALFDKIEELRYEGASNKLVEREVYTYNAQGQRTSEVTLDDKGVLIKKAIYTYDKKGLKLEKKTVDGKDKLLSDKKYTYEYK